MKIKSKLRLGIGLLFFMIILLSVVAASYVNVLKNDTGNILIDNYHTLGYSRNMLLALDEIQVNPRAILEFEENLSKQKDNLTEAGEKEATQKIQDHFDSLKTNPGNLSVYMLVRKELLENQRTGSLNEEQKQLIESIKEDSNRLLKITGELLDMSQVETGNIQQSSPYEIVRYALDAVKVQAEQKQIALALNADDNLPEVKADTEKTAWVLINFLTNAIRYSGEESEIVVHVKKNQNRVVFSVKDEGKGIDSRYRDKIFDRYFQIPGSSKTGTGLGLAISKEFIEAQGGNIGLESELGMGSTFYFNLYVA